MTQVMALLDLTEITDGGLAINEIIVRLGLAMVLGMAVGIERESTEHSAGMRTYAVVSMASALIMIVSSYGVPVLGNSAPDAGRIAAQVVSGIGFLGAGVIFMRRDVVHGLTTAASLWAVSGIGLAVGGGLKWTAAIATAYLLLLTAGLRPVKNRLFRDENRRHRIRISLVDAGDVIASIRSIARQQPRFTIDAMTYENDTDAKRSSLEVKLKVKDSDDAIEIVHKLEQLPGVDHITWSADLDD